MSVRYSRIVLLLRPLIVVRYPRYCSTNRHVLFDCIVSHSFVRSIGIKEAYNTNVANNKKFMINMIMPIYTEAAMLWEKEAQAEQTAKVFLGTM